MISEDKDFEVPIPKYYKLKMDLIKQIRDGSLPENAKIPSEKELCEQYGISRITVRKTLDELVASKFVYKIQGKGSFVCSRTERMNMKVSLNNILSCSDMIEKQGLKASHKVITYKVIPCPESKADCLKVEPGERVLQYDRVYFGDKKPVIYATSLINLRKLPSIEFVDISRFSLSNLFVKSYGFTLSRQRWVIQAISADETIAQLLGVSAGFPILYRSTTTIASDKEGSFPIEINSLYCRTDKLPFVTE